MVLKSALCALCLMVAACAGPAVDAPNLLMRERGVEASFYKVVVELNCQVFESEKFEAFAASKSPGEEVFTGRQKIQLRGPGDEAGQDQVGPFPRGTVIILQIPYGLMRRAETDLRVELVALRDRERNLTQVVELGPLPPPSLPMAPR